MVRLIKEYFFRVVLPVLAASILCMGLFRTSTRVLSISGLARSSRASLENKHQSPSLNKAIPSILDSRMSSTEPSAIPEAVQAASGTPCPKLSPAEFRTYNRLADMMQQYHNHFRTTWTTLYTACQANKRPAGMSIRQFLALGDRFCSSLGVHHGIEERYIFPVLAERMPRFKDQAHLKKQHEGIHEGLDVFEQYLKDCLRGETELRLDEMKRIMDTFGEVLWAHLDDEVEELGAENMRKFWTAKEVQEIPF